MTRRTKGKDQSQQPDLLEELIVLNRTSKAVKGGRTMSFSAAVVVGDGNGKVGYGQGKSKDVSGAIKKATEAAKADMRTTNHKVHLLPGSNTISYKFDSKYGASRVRVMPASTGRGIIAGNAMRSVFLCAGIYNVVAKSYGSPNPMNVVKATIKGLQHVKTAAQVTKMRGKIINNALARTSEDA